ncbi:MAG: SMI1/KNR4 family protein [Bacteroidetes bacterium]|nr:SMI1/KNR4 family protein [Bacteroidota bacterium]MCB9227882.1 SMI1/KNR4 family protein [Chitinophagales bacterium]
MKKILENILLKIENLGGESRELIFENPASEEQLLKIEKELNYKIPNEFRNVLLNVSAHLEFKWFLPDDFELPKELDGIFCGEIHWGTNFIIDFNKSKDNWIKVCFPDQNNEYDKVWHNKFVFQEVGNGDYLSIDISEENYGKIIYLSHDDGEGHGFIMSNSFTELIDNWGNLGFPGGEDWQWLPFTKNKNSGINPKCKNANTWKKIIGVE